MIEELKNHIRNRVERFLFVTPSETSFGNYMEYVEFDIDALLHEIDVFSESFKTGKPIMKLPEIEDVVLVDMKDRYCVGCVFHNEKLDRCYRPQHNDLCEGGEKLFILKGK